VVKVQSGREESIKEAVERRVKIEGLEEYYGEILIPFERETIMRNGKRVIRERKLFPGYLMAKVEYNDRILYLFRETSGVGDFVGAGVNHPPQPMKDHEVEKMLAKMHRAEPSEVKPTKPKFERGDRVKVKDGVFAGMEGEVKDLLEAKGLVRVELTVLGRPVPVELEYWQVEQE
jgi:transcriptional antiterminator NusG